MKDEPREIELKLEASPQDMKRLKRELARQRSFGVSHRPETLESIYFDTDKFDLRRGGLIWRIRRNGVRRIQTVKRAAGAAAGLFDRGEWERQIEGERPDLAVADEIGIDRPILKKLRHGMKPVFRTVIERSRYEIGDGDGLRHINLALDQGEVTTRGRSSPICEVELELDRGDPAQLFKLARRLCAIAPLRLGVKSKAERGFDLIENAGAAKAGKLALARGMTTGAGFRLIAQACLHQLVANELALQRGDFEALHQMRVAMRRLRATMSLFKRVVIDAKAKFIKSELKWLAAQFAPARDLDVFLTEAVEPARKRHRRDDVATGMSGFETDIAARRRNALERARKAAASARFRDLMLTIAEWIAAGPWALRRGAAARRRREHPVEKHAAKEMSRRRRKIIRRGKKLRKLAARPRHKLRIEAKKLGYATDFFATLFQGKAARRRRKALASALKGFRDGLGHLNDIAARHAIGLEVARSGGRHSGPHMRRRAFASGLVVGEQEAQIAPLLDAAADAYRDLRKAKPFWK